MNCQQVIPLLSAFHDGELPADQREAVMDHLVDCSDCQAELASLKSLSGLIRHSPPPEPPAALVRKVERALQRDTQKTPVRSNFFRWISVPVTMAAVVLLAVVIWQSWPVNHDLHDH